MEEVKKQESGPEEPEKSKIKVVTLPEQGPVLPIGLDPAGTQREFAFKRWNLGKDKELGELRKKLPNSSLGEWASVLLSEMATRIGPHDFTKLTFPERRLILSQMWMADVLYAYCYLRYHAMGPILRVRMECPFHEYMFTWPGDLRTLNVKTIERLDDAKWSFDLRDPFEVRGKESKSWRLGPPRWSAVEEAQLGRRVNQGKLKAIMIHASIYEVDGEEIALAENELNEMGKWDMENHVAEIDKHSVGPDLSIEVRCDDPKCDRRFETSVDWGYDTFFSISSR